MPLACEPFTDSALFFSIDSVVLSKSCTDGLRTEKSTVTLYHQIEKHTINHIRPTVSLTIIDMLLKWILTDFKWKKMNKRALIMISSTKNLGRWETFFSNFFGISLASRLWKYTKSWQRDQDCDPQNVEIAIYTHNLCSFIEPSPNCISPGNRKRVYKEIFTQSHFDLHILFRKKYLLKSIKSIGICSHNAPKTL